MLLVTYGRGLGGLPRTVLHEVLRAVWWEVWPDRVGLHRLAGVRHCDTQLRYGSLVLGTSGSDGGRRRGPELRLAGECPCRDLLADVLVEADAYLMLRAGTLHNPPGAVRRHVRTRAVGDWTRRRRLATGAQARTDRIRRSARARSLPDEFHRSVLANLVEEAGSPAPLVSQAHLCRRLADLAAAEFGGDPGTWLRQVQLALPAVEAAGRRGPLVVDPDGGRVTWWERYVEVPLGRRPCPAAVSSDELADLVDLAVPIGLTGDDVPNEAEALVVDTMLAVGAAPDGDVRSGVRRAMARLTDAGLVAPAVTAAFLADEARVDTVVGIVGTELRTRGPAARANDADFGGSRRAS